MIRSVYEVGWRACDLCKSETTPTIYFVGSWKVTLQEDVKANLFICTNCYKRLRNIKEVKP